MLVSQKNILRKSAEEILSYENSSVISRFVKEHGVTEKEAKDCFNALKQFLAASVIDSGGRVISKPVDDIWHTFILFTKDYQYFCEEYLGKFIHHVPDENSDKHFNSSTRDTALKLFRTIDERFGAAPVNADCGSCDCCPAR